MLPCHSWMLCLPGEKMQKVRLKGWGESWWFSEKRCTCAARLLAVFPVSCMIMHVCMCLVCDI